MTPRLSPTALERTVFTAILMMFVSRVLLPIVQLFLARSVAVQSALRQTIGGAMHNNPNLSHLPAASWVLFVAGVQLALVVWAVILLYRYRSQAEAYLSSHFQYLIYTFWLGFLYSVILSVIALQGGKFAVSHGFYTAAFFTPIISSGILIIFNLSRLLKSYWAIRRHSPISKPRSWGI